MAKKKSAAATRKNIIEKRKKKQRQQYILVGSLFFVGVLIFAVYTLVQSNAPTVAETNGASLPVAAEIGSVAPDFELPAHEGGTLRLSNFRGQPVAVTFMHTW